MASDDATELALDAAMAMLDRYGGVWAIDADYLRGQLAVIIDAAMTLGSDYGPSAWNEAKITLRDMIHRDA